MAAAFLPPQLVILTSPDWQDYELLDSGEGAKLERFGAFTFIRPEHQAVWTRKLPIERWQAAHATFQTTLSQLPGTQAIRKKEHKGKTREDKRSDIKKLAEKDQTVLEQGGHWTLHKSLPPDWVMHYKGLRFKVAVSNSRHLGVFPEQANHWDWMTNIIQNARRPVHILNLFGYTGLATLAAAQAGASVTHVDASKKAINWARQNQALSHLDDRSIRWLIDDAEKFIRRELRRGNKYEGIILDPPKFGRGPEGQVWEFFESLPALLAHCRNLLSPRPLFIVITAYAIRASALCLYYGLEEMVSGLDGQTTMGELALVEKSAGRLLPTAIFARWEAT